MFGHHCLLLCATGLILLSRPKISAASDGDIIGVEPQNQELPVYDDYLAFENSWYNIERKDAEQSGFSLPPSAQLKAQLLSRPEYELRTLHDGYVCERIVYVSDGLRVVALVFRPTHIEQLLPLIIFNRGGNREFGKLRPDNIIDFYPYLAAGFTVIGSQYRGNDGGDGQEEFGGSDVDDVLNLVPLADNLGYIDHNRIGMLGESRGGMMTYLAIKHGIRISTAVVIGAPVDEEAEAIRRPMLDVYCDLVPGFVQDPQRCYRERSALCWPEYLNVPLLILHGGSDWRVDPHGALALGQRLKELGRPHALVIFDHDDHMLDLHRAEKERLIIAWFTHYLNLNRNDRIDKRQEQEFSFGKIP